MCHRMYRGSGDGDMNEVLPCDAVRCILSHAVHPRVRAVCRQWRDLVDEDTEDSGLCALLQACRFRLLPGQRPPLRWRMTYRFGSIDAKPCYVCGACGGGVPELGSCDACRYKRRVEFPWRRAVVLPVTVMAGVACVLWRLRRR